MTRQNLKKQLAKAIVSVLLSTSFVLTGCAQDTTQLQTQPSAEATQPVTQAQTTPAERLGLAGYPFIPGAIDWINVAIQNGGQTTYVPYSYLIGAQVTQRFQNNKLIYENLEPVENNITYVTDEQDFYTIPFKVEKLPETITADYIVSDSIIADTLLSMTLSLPDIQDGLGDKVRDLSPIKNDYASIELAPNSNNLVVQSFANNSPNFLQNNTDIITTTEFIEQLSQQGLSGFQLLANSSNISLRSLQPATQSEATEQQDSQNTDSQFTNELLLLADQSLWGDLLLAQLEYYELYQKDFVIRYAPNDPDNKSSNINEWKINNYDIDLWFCNRDTQETFKYTIITTHDNNVYNDNRAIVTGLWTDNLNETEFSRLVKAIYLDKSEQVDNVALSSSLESFGYSAQNTDITEDYELSYYHVIRRPSQPSTVGAEADEPAQQ